MKINLLVLVMLFFVITCICSCKNTQDINENVDINNSDSAEESHANIQEPSDEGIESVAQDPMESSDADSVSAEESPANTQEPSDKGIEGVTQTPVESTAVGGTDYSFSRKYIDEVYNIQIAYETVGKEVRDEWANNVFLKKSAEEQEALPPIYQMIVELEIPKEDLVKKNNQYDEPYLADNTIDALYEQDVQKMQQLLANPLALYYDGEIYTFDELACGLQEVDIPEETLDNYFDRIVTYCEQEKMLKYMQEDIDNARKACGLDVSYDGE